MPFFANLRKLFAPKKVRIYYQAKSNNFGDKLNENLLDFFACPYKRVPAKKAEFIAIGSILNSFIKKRPFHLKHRIKVFGSGFIKHPESEIVAFSDEMEFYALRGKLSRELCQKISGENAAKIQEVALGDPGLLVKRMFPHIKRNKKYDVGIILHFKDKGAFDAGHLDLQKNSYTFIDIQQPCENFVSAVAECDFILSSAMHGLICADSLNIPNKHLIIGDNVIGGEYKFRDYYSVFDNVDYQPVYLANHPIITDRDIADYRAQYQIKEQEVDKICDDLIKAFPYK